MCARLIEFVLLAVAFAEIIFWNASGNFHVSWPIHCGGLARLTNAVPTNKAGIALVALFTCATGLEGILLARHEDVAFRGTACL